MLTVVTMLWNGSARDYRVEHAERLRRQFKKHLTVPHKFVCVSTDKSAPGYVPLWPFPDVQGRFSVANYVKLGIFGEPGKQLGERLLFCDLDTVIRANIDDLITDDAIKVLRWGNRPYLQGALTLLDAGSRPDIWEGANTQSVVERAELLHHGTDQALMSLYLFRDVVCGLIPYWSATDGITINKPYDAWRVFCAAASPKPWEDASPVKEIYYSESKRDG